MVTNTYTGGLAEQSVQHYYGGSESTPSAKKEYTSRKKSCKGGSGKMSCKKKTGGKGKK